MESFSWNLENWEASAKKTKSSISIRLRYFHCLSHFLICGPLQLNKSCFQKIDLNKLLKNCVTHCFKFDAYVVIPNLLYYMKFWNLSIATPYCNYSLLFILLLAAFCSAIWNLVDFELFFPVAILCCVLTICYYISYDVHEVLLMKLCIVQYNYRYCKKYCWLYQLLLLLTYKIEYYWVLAVLYCNG